MDDAYRSPATLPAPACMRCLVPMVFDGLWAHWLCRSCGGCSCDAPSESVER